MKTMHRIPIQNLAAHQNEHPGMFPIFGRIRTVKGERIGEIIGYSDEYGTPINTPDIKENTAEATLH